MAILSSGCVSTQRTTLAATPWAVGGVHSFRVQADEAEADRAAEKALAKRLREEATDESVVVASR
jgi:hypothetical protein